MFLCNDCGEVFDEPHEATIYHSEVLIISVRNTTASALPAVKTTSPRLCSANAARTIL